MTINRHIFILIFSLTTHHIFSQTRIYPDDPNILYIGRIDFSNPKQPSFHHSGVTIKAAFEGKRIDLIMKGNSNSYFNVVIDNSLPFVLKLNETDTVYSIKKDLAEGSHVVELTRRAETFWGLDKFLGFQLEQYKKLLPVARSNRRMEFIGNSITCGYGIEATDLSIPFKAETENASLAFAGIAARSLSAEQITICRSGIGVYKNIEDTIPSAEPMPAVYDRIYLNNPTPKWNFDSYVPQVVVVDLGTNDFYGGADSTLFVQSFESFVKTIRGNYSNSKIFIVTGPMLGGDDLAKIKVYLSSMVDRFNKAGDENVFFFEISRQGCCGYGTAYHPSVAQGAKNGKELAAFIESKTDWRVRPEVVSSRITPEGNAIEITFSKPMSNPKADTGSFFIELNYEKVLKATNARLNPSDNRIVLLDLPTNLKRQDVVSISYLQGLLQSADGEFLGTFAPIRPRNTVLNSLLSESNNFDISVINVDEDSKKIVINGIVSSETEIVLYNLQGIKVCTLFRGNLSRGRNEIDWNSKSLRGGLYLLRSELNGEVICRRVHVN